MFSGGHSYWTTVPPFSWNTRWKPEAIDDPLTSVLRDGARRLLAEAIEAEAEAFLAAMQDERLADGPLRHPARLHRRLWAGRGRSAMGR
ncbi:hypothetical protein LCGC14_0352450 [marine sediment metagenome]|uniref:Uncharacterized protein n=1 Tax=marine sediment metagenome TaxID=412755 RepID=A0A0F9TAJ8_9ZZZZ